MVVPEIPLSGSSLASFGGGTVICPIGAVTRVAIHSSNPEIEGASVEDKTHLSQSPSEIEVPEELYLLIV